jgi:hypothetical protein
LAEDIGQMLPTGGSAMILLSKRGDSDSILGTINRSAIDYPPIRRIWLISNSNRLNLIVRSFI